MTATAPEEIAHDKIRAAEWKHGRLNLIDRRLLLISGCGPADDRFRERTLTLRAVPSK